MVRVWSDLAWNDYLEFFNKHQKDLIKSTHELIKDIERNGVDKGKGQPEQLKVFISELSKCEILDNRFKIILIESIAGKTPSKKDGVLYFVSNYTNLKNELIEIVDKLLNFQIIEDKELADRLSDAKKSYEKAFKNFSSKKGKRE